MLVVRAIRGAHRMEVEVGVAVQAAPAVPQYLDSRVPAAMALRQALLELASSGLAVVALEVPAITALQPAAWKQMLAAELAAQAALQALTPTPIKAVAVVVAEMPDSAAAMAALG